MITVMKKFLPRNINNPQGFTLVELMVVITIIAILSIVGVTIYSGVQAKAQDSKRRADIDSISNAIEVHFNSTTGNYAAGLGDWFSSGSAPKDPKSGVDYSGWPNISAATYSVCATLSDTTLYCKKEQQ